MAKLTPTPPVVSEAAPVATAGSVHLGLHGHEPGVEARWVPNPRTLFLVLLHFKPCECAELVNIGTDGRVCSEEAANPVPRVTPPLTQPLSTPSINM